VPDYQHQAGARGRIGRARAIQSFAQEHDMAVWCGGMLEAGIGRAHNLSGLRLYLTLPFSSRKSRRGNPAGREMILNFASGSRVAGIYGALEAKEQYYCNFGVNPNVVEFLKRGPMQVVSSDKEGEIRVLELPDHPFFIATLFVPQTRSQPGGPHPLVTAFLSAVVKSRDTSRTVAVAS
jgi:hypothetical protein